MLYISEKTISEAFWSGIYSSPHSKAAELDCAAILEQSRQIRSRFPGGAAGTISSESAKQLWLVARYFSPKHIFEIGTFIGRSTLSLLAGAEPSIEQIDTCDYSYDQFIVTDQTKEAFPKSSRIRYWGKTSSTVALQELLSAGLRPDFIFIDGRLGDSDLALLRHLDASKTVYVLDDFEGIEKGVENSILLRKLLPSSVLIRPRHDNLAGNGYIAVIVPASMLQITRQQDLPISLQP